MGKDDNDIFSSHSRYESESWTALNDIAHRHTLDVGHVSDDREDDKARKHRRTTVDRAHLNVSHRKNGKSSHNKTS